MFMRNIAWVAAIWMTIIIGLAGCGEKPEPVETAGSAASTIQTEIATAQMTNVPNSREITGMVQSAAEATISAKIMGRIEQIRVREGDRASAGDILIDIDNRGLSALQQQAQAALAAAKNAEQAAAAGVESAKSAERLAYATFLRFKTLLEQESVAQQEFDEVDARRKQAAAALAQAEEMQNAARNQTRQAEAAAAAASIRFQETQVKAPFSGVVTAKLTDPGDLAAPGMPLLKMETVTGKEVHSHFPERLMAGIDPGGQVEIVIPAWGGERLPGKIRTVSPAADPRSRSFLVTIEIPDHDGLRSGMFVRVRVPTPGGKQLRIPSTAVVRHGQLEGVFLLDEDDIARFRLIRTGEASDRWVEVLTGIRDGDRYIPNPPSSLQDGNRVEAGS